MSTRVIRPMSADHLAAIKTTLQDICPAGGEVFGIVRKVNATGTVRYVTILVALHVFDGRPTILDITQRVAVLCGFRVDEHLGAIRVGGVGFSPIGHVVGDLSRLLHGDEYALTVRTI